jgi:hypothetical protein
MGFVLLGFMTSGTTPGLGSQKKRVVPGSFDESQEELKQKILLQQWLGRVKAGDSDAYRGSLGGRSCPRDLPVCAFVSRIGITGSPTVGRRSGC